jgi:hypothetical protein
MFLSGMDILFGENYSSRSSITKLEEAAQPGHNVAAYVATMVVYRANGNVGDNDTARWYIRQVEGEEESTAATSMMMQMKKGCLRCCEAASEVIRRVTWRRHATLAPPVARGNHQCAGRLCFKMSWEEWSHFCNEECRIHAECDMFFSKIIGYLHPNELP